MEETSVNDLKSVAEEMLEMSDNELMENLPTLTPKLKGKVKEIMNAMPDLPRRIVKKMDETNVKKMANEAPKAVDAFTEILWEGIAAVAEKNEEFKKALKNVGNIKLNYEADDSPMCGHEEINNAKITGGPGKLNSVDITVRGNTDVLVKLVTGGLDPVKGLMMRKFKLEGPLALGMKLTGAMKAMADALKA
jgi:putative sterol carrier protein